MVIDPSMWQTMLPFNQGQGGGGNQRPMPNAAPDPYQAIIEAQRRYREESDRAFDLQLKQLSQERDRIAISRNQAEANAWYQREMARISAAKLAEDKRQFDISTQEAIRQFNLKQQELIRQFDITTAEGRRQYDLSLAENQRQFDATFGQRAREFEQDLAFRRDTLAEQMRQYDLTRADERERFAREHGLDIRRLEEEARQFDLTREDQRYQFAARLAEEQRQFDVNATGYINGQATLEREQWQNQALMDWTDRAIALASNPADWVKYKQMTTGVAGNLGSIPGLAWTEGGQVGNTAFSGTPQPNSLGNVLGAMGINQPAAGAPPGGAPAVPGQPGAPAPAATPLTPEEMARFNQLVSRRAQVQEAGEGDLSPVDLQELARFQARLQQTGGAPLSPQEQARYEQIKARRAQLQAAGEGDVSFEDRQELARYEARLGGASAGGGDQMNYAGGTPGWTGPNAAQGAAPQGGGQAAGGVTNWAYQAAGMLPSNDQLRANMTDAERQIWDTADQFARAPQQASSGWWEQQDPMTRELIRGAAQAQGHDWQTVLSRYGRSRWGGGGSVRAA